MIITPNLVSTLNDDNYLTSQKCEKNSIVFIVFLLFFSFVNNRTMENNVFNGRCCFGKNKKL